MRKLIFLFFKTTGGSNLDPDDDAVDLLGNSYSLERDICQKYDLILAITDYSLTAPLTAFAKKYGFRGATLHGVNEIILNSGLSVDYRKISEQAECFRSVLDQADSFILHFQVNEQEFEFKLIAVHRSLKKAMVYALRANLTWLTLPAGEVYFVPSGANGSFPFKYSDGTLAEMLVEDGKITSAKLISGDQNLVDARNQQLKDDPATGIIGELGFGTQLLPFSVRIFKMRKFLVLVMLQPAEAIIWEVILPPIYLTLK